jgi:hypothetical protein
LILAHSLEYGIILENNESLLVLVKTFMSKGKHFEFSAYKRIC